MKGIIPQERIESIIFLIRGQKVMLDVDLAVLYGVKTRTLNQAVKRNAERFPEDFMFQLTWDEVRCLRSQIVILKDDEKKRGKHIKYLPYAFTEQGIAMLSSVLRSKRAIQVNIMIVKSIRSSMPSRRCSNRRRALRERSVSNPNPQSPVPSPQSLAPSS